MPNSPQEGISPPTLSVSQLNRQARQLLESHFDFIWVSGEISNFASPASGHWYFSLKDGDAQVRCAMFRGRNQRLRFRPGNGDAVRLRCRVSLYEGRGEFQLIVEFIEPAGDGALQLAFEKLKARLQTEGLFDPDRKLPIPAQVFKLAVVTSPPAQRYTIFSRYWQEEHRESRSTCCLWPFRAREPRQKSPGQCRI